jgi:hypothetical protein
MMMHTGLKCGKLASKTGQGASLLAHPAVCLWSHMQLRLLIPVFLERSLLRVLCISLNSCQSHKANSVPSIEFAPVPPVAQGGRERIDTISGRPETPDQSSRLLFVRTAGHSGCCPGRHTSDRDGDR